MTGGGHDLAVWCSMDARWGRERDEAWPGSIECDGEAGPVSHYCHSSYGHLAYCNQSTNMLNRAYTTHVPTVYVYCQPKCKSTV